MSPVLVALILQLIPLIPAAIAGVTEAIKAIKFGFGVVQDAVAENRDPTPEEWDKINQLIAANRTALHDTSSDA